MPGKVKWLTHSTAWFDKLTVSGTRSTNSRPLRRTVLSPSKGILSKVEVLRVNPERSRSFKTRIVEGLIFCGYGMLAGIILTGATGWADVRPLRVHFMDVGYGDAILIEFQDTTTMLIDAGNTRYSSRLMSYLKANQIRKIGTVVITHPHQNHFGGLRKIASRIPVGRVFHNGDPNAEKGYSALLSYLERKRVPVEILKSGQKLEQLTDSIAVEVLNPPDLNGSVNNNSLALWLKHDKVSFLLLADIGPDRQDALLAAFPDIRQADCVLIPHHGGPLSEAFIESFPEKLFIISTGPNRWGLPREDQLKELNGTVYRTDRNGTIVVESDGNTLKVGSWIQNGN